jgi:hypothetical protein
MRKVKMEMVEAVSLELSWLMQVGFSPIRSMVCFCLHSQAIGNSVRCLDTLPLTHVIQKACNKSLNVGCDFLDDFLGWP